MTNVPRHAVDPDLARRQVAVIAPKVDVFLSYVERKASALTAVHQWAITAAQYRCVLDPDVTQSDTWHDLRIAEQAAGVTFSATQASDGEVPYEIGGNTVRIPATGPVSAANGGKWLTVVWLAVALRDEDTVQRLCAVPLDTLRASGAQHDDYMYAWVETLQRFLRKEPIPPELFTAAMRGTDPDEARIASGDAMLQLVYPPIKMFYYLLRRDERLFNEALEQALTLHRGYWTAEDRADDPDGFLALAPLGVAVLARKVGLAIDVRSEYLPSGLLEGREPGQ
jgi:hypothetical protein